MPETLRFFSVQLALIAVVLVLHTYLGLHIIRRTLVFSDLVLDQLAAFGALVAIGLGVKYGTIQAYLASLVAVIFGSALLALIGEAYVTKTLVGCMLWATWPLVGVTTLVYIALLVFHYSYCEKFISLTQKTPDVRHERLWDFLFFTTQGIVTVLIVPVAGVLLAYSFLMIPAAIAAMFTKGWANAVALGWSLGFVACSMGLSASYYFDLPYGPSLVLALGLFFVSAVLLRAMLSQRVRADTRGVTQG